MLVYHYNEETKEYTHSEEAVLDPLEKKLNGKDVYLLPANATFEVPPPTREDYANVWQGNEWQAVEDNRGKNYWLDTDEYGTPAREMKELGVFPEGAVFIAPEKPFDMLKSEKIAELKAERDSREVEPIEYNGNTFDYDEKARDRISAAIVALEISGGSLEWTTADNTQVTVTAADLKGVIVAVAQRSNDLHNAYRVAKERVQGAENKEELDAITLL